MERTFDPAPRTGPELTLAGQAALVAALRPLLQAREGGPVELIETHISWVLVTPRHAYKLKKALRLDFLDFSTRARRTEACREELRLNRRHAPALYLDVVAVSGTPAAPVLGGAGPAIEPLLRMRAFAQDGLWDRLAARGALTPAMVDELADRVAAFHAAAAVAPVDSGFGRPETVRAPMLDNLDALAAPLHDPASQRDLAALRAWEAAAWPRLVPLIEQRRREGRVRECHGDLHLGNVAQIDGRATPFDGIEFNDAFRWIDVASDIAFLAMDLHAHGLPALAHRFVDGWLQAGGDFGAVALLPWTQAYRALVRAKVAALRATQDPTHAPAALAAAQRGLAVARALTRPLPRVLVAMHGLAGSGKTTLSQALLEASGATRVRADVERKRLAGLTATARSGSALDAGLYGADATAATYARLCENAATLLDGGAAVILDATFLTREQRAQARVVARAAGVPFVIVAPQADAATLRARVRRRAAAGSDASEADLAVLEAQFGRLQALAPDEADHIERVPAGQPLDAAARRRILAPGGDAAAPST